MLVCFSTAHHKLHGDGINNRSAGARILFKNGARFGSIGFVHRLCKNNELLLAGELRLNFHTHIIIFLTNIIFNFVNNSTTAYGKRNAAVCLYNCPCMRILIKDGSFITRDIGIFKLNLSVQLLCLHFKERRLKVFAHHIRHHHLFCTFYGSKENGKAHNDHYQESDDDRPYERFSTILKMVHIIVV